MRTATMTVTICVVAAFIAGCGGGSSSSGSSVYSGKTTQATIDSQSVNDTLASVDEVIPSCTAAGLPAKVALSAPQGALATLKILKRTLPPAASKRAGKSVSLISSTPPAPSSGSCGGTLSYPTWNHSSGTTTISIKWNNYCTIDSTSGNHETVNGTMTAVDVGTPSPSGPVTTKLTANIPSLTVVETTAGGTVVASESVALSGFQYTPQAGTTPTLANPLGTTVLTSFEMADVKNNKSYKIQNLNLTTSASGTDTQMTMSVRVFRSTSGYSDVTTPVPLVVDANGNLKAGKVTFTGANGSNASLTVVPGTGQRFTVDVNGTPLAGTQLNCAGL